MKLESARSYRLVSLSLAALLLVVGLLTHVALMRIEEQTREDVGESLKTVVDSTQEAQSIWIKNHKEYLVKIAADPRLVELVVRHAEVEREREALLESETLRELREYFDSRRGELEHYGFFVITPDKMSIASRRNENIGVPNPISSKRPEFLAKAFLGESVFVLPCRSEVRLGETLPPRSPTMFFAVPVKVGGEVIAVLTLRIHPGRDFTRLTQIGRIGDSGETYAFDRRGTLISNSRFNDQLRSVGLVGPQEEGILNIRISDPGVNLLEGKEATAPPESRELTLMAKNATAGNNGMNVEGYRDYRGVKVLGAWLWNEELGYGLTTEIDEEEALETFYATKRIILILISVTIGLSFLLACLFFVFERRAREMLRRSHRELEEKVTERTAALERSYQTIKVHRDEIERSLGKQKELADSLARANSELQASQSSLARRNEEMRMDLKVAKEFQQAVLSHVPEVSFLNQGVLYLPYHGGVSGDVYDLCLTRAGDLSVFLGDATGHGISAAFMTMRVQIALDSIGEDLPVDRALSQINRLLSHRARGDKFVTGVYLRVTESGALSVAHAGHPPTIIVPGDGGEVILLGGGAMPLGMTEREIKPYERMEYQLRPGDRIFVYTDGITEWENADGELFGTERLKGVLACYRGREVEAVLNLVLNALREFACGVDCSDDATILGFEYRGGDGGETTS